MFIVYSYMRVCVAQVVARNRSGMTIVVLLGSGYRIVPEGMRYPDIGVTWLNIFE